MFKKIAVAATLALVATSSFAQRTNIYAGADFGTTQLDDLSGRASSFGSFVGYQFTPMFGVEANIRRLADTSEKFVDVRVMQAGLSVIGTMPVYENLNGFLRVGYNRLRVRETNAILGTFDETKNKGMYGIGLSYAFCPVVIGRVEYQRPNSESKNLSASVVFKF